MRSTIGARKSDRSGNSYPAAHRNNNPHNNPYRNTHTRAVSDTYRCAGISESKRRRAGYGTSLVQ